MLPIILVMALRARPVLAASALAAGVGVLGTLSVAFTDYEVEAEPSAVALAAGHFQRFAQTAPAYGGSFVLRAPLALLAGALGFGHDEPLYRALVLPALIATVWLAVLLFGRLGGTRGAWLALVLAAASPFTLEALQTGHPEEVLGGALCVAALLLAQRDRWLAAGVLLGLAGTNKPWALLAALPVLLSLQRDRVRCASVAVAVCGVLLAPLLLAGSVAGSIGAVATDRTVIFQPWQVFWFFGEHGAPVIGSAGEKVGFRSAVGWAQTVSHPLVIVAGLGLAALAAGLRRGRDAGFALLALVMLTRCLLDTWDTSYYVIPFLMALLAHEVLTRERAPLASAAITAGLWVSFGLLHTPDLQAAAFLAVALPAWGGLVVATFLPAAAARLTARAQAAASRRLPSLVAQPVSSVTAPRSSGALTVRP